MMSREKKLKATKATTNVVALVMALFGTIEVASANHELAVTFQHLDGYEGACLPIGVRVNSSCQPGAVSALERWECGDIVVALGYDCEYQCANGVCDQVCDKVLQESLPPAPLPQFLFTIPGEDVVAPSFDFHVFAGQTRARCALGFPGNCIASDVREVRAPAFGEESVHVESARWSDE